MLTWWEDLCVTIHDDGRSARTSAETGGYMESADSFPSDGASSVSALEEPFLRRSLWRSASAERKDPLTQRAREVTSPKLRWKLMEGPT